MCKCKDVIPQSQECYDQMTMLKVPKNLGIRKNVPEGERYVCVDPCLASEVEGLWAQGIATTGCCCGHNIDDLRPYIGVRDKFIPKMKELG